MPFDPLGRKKRDAELAKVYEQIVGGEFESQDAATQGKKLIKHITGQLPSGDYTPDGKPKKKKR